MSESSAKRLLSEGALILANILGPHGFKRSAIQSGRASGGSYASCTFRRHDRRLCLHFRHSLGLVEYEIAGVRLSHEDFMWSVIGRRGASSYPGFSDDPLDGFRHLASDLQQYGQVFLTGSAEEFARVAAQVAGLKTAASRLPE